eukprot:gb/GEZN01014940.1/.p1 GENE.gb/GEZN01014940.1/~~gb/GEZN01014940.1/.p1  ORF type:complete len:211 (+),score=36.40 gb/GEZN01014940.1/:145-777(+)
MLFCCGVILAYFVSPSDGYGSGAPICGTTTLDLITGMGAQRTKSTTNGGWVVSASSATYKPGKDMTISIVGGLKQEPLKGFVLDAVSAVTGDRVGEFQPELGATRTTCYTEAFLTHATPSADFNRVTVWRAPPKGTGPVTFSAIAYTGPVGDQTAASTFFVAIATTVQESDEAEVVNQQVDTKDSNAGARMSAGPTMVAVLLAAVTFTWW